MTSNDIARGIAILGGLSAEPSSRDATGIVIYVSDIDPELLASLRRESMIRPGLDRTMLFLSPYGSFELSMGASPPSAIEQVLERMMRTEVGFDYRYREPVPSFLVAPVVHDREPRQSGGPPVRYQDTKCRPPRKLGRKYSRHDNRGF